MGIIYFIFFISVFVVFKNEAISSSNGGGFCWLGGYLCIGTLVYFLLAPLRHIYCLYEQLAFCSYLKSTDM